MDIAVYHLYKTFGVHEVLKDISLNIENVHNIAILGASGSGKTTLLRVIAGLDPPSKGYIKVNGVRIPYDGKPIDKSSALIEYRTQIGVVFQSFNLLPHLSALQNIVLPLVKVHKYNKDYAHEKARALFAHFSLSDHTEKKAHQLSGGQKQRVAICRALAPSPKFLLFDEPTSALDPDFIKEVLEVIKGLRGRQDFIIVTHHTGFAKSIADYILFLDDGKIIAEGTPEQVYEQSPHPKVSQFFHNIIH